MKRKFEQFNINNEYIDECAKKFNNSDKDKICKNVMTIMKNYLL